MRPRLRLPLLALLASLMILPAHAAWPERGVRIIVPFPAGGPADNSTRVVAKRLAELWGKPVVVENRPGAAGMVAGANAAPDGYSLILGAGSHIVTAPLMNPKMAYVPMRDFAPVSLILTNTPVITVHPGTGIKTLRELIAYAKAKPGTLNYSSAGMGSPGHLTMEMLTDLTQTNMVHVPYKGGAPAVAELVGGHVQLGVNATPTVLQHIQTGKLTALAVASTRRDRSLPQVPTTAEAGVNNLGYFIWYGLFAPAKTPRDIVNRVSADVQKVLSEPAIAETIRIQGGDPEGASPEKFKQMIEDDIAVWARLIREKKLTLEE